MFRVVSDRERWFQIVMGEEYRTDEFTTDRLEARIPLPEAAASAVPAEAQRMSLKARGIRALLADWDPLGVTESDGSSAAYECLVWPLTRLLDREASAEQVASFLSSELAGRFGVDAQTGEPGQFASRLIAWFRANVRNITE